MKRHAILLSLAFMSTLCTSSVLAEGADTLSYEVKCSIRSVESTTYHPVIVDVAASGDYYTLYFDDLSAKFVPINSCIVDIINTKFNKKRLKADAKHRAKYNIKQHEGKSW